MTSAPGDELLFLPLGGAGEIGMNLNLYGYGPVGSHRWLMIDCGVSFGSGIPGVDVVMPDPGFIAARRDALEGLVVTHAHEDHLGAIPYLWRHLRCPVYATPFAAAVLRRKLRETGLLSEVDLLPIPDGQPLVLGPFTLQAIGMTHSIPESRAFALRTPLGTVIHTGDWKLDPEPVVGAPSDVAMLQTLGDAGVRALICDSTNVFMSGTSGSESSLRDPLCEIVGRFSQRVVVTCFATNVARLRTLAEVAAASGRDVVVVGASMKRIYAAALECGYLRDLPPFLDEDMAERLPRQKTLVVCTGGQGEPRAALWRIAAGEHPSVSLERGDAVIFSSRVIPGNELAIARLYNVLLRQGVEVITHREGHIHVSGHPARDELAQLYRLLRPEVAVPVHGEVRHLQEHARLAKAQGVAETVLVENGTVTRIAPGPAAVIDHVPVGRWSLEGNRSVNLDGELVRGRLKALYQGVVVATIVAERKVRAVRDVQITTIGLINGEESALAERFCADARRAVESMAHREFLDDDGLKEVARIAVRRSANSLLNIKPLAHIHLVRV